MKRERRSCANCGVDVERYPSLFVGKKHIYCSRRCMVEHQSIIMLGKNNPNFRNSWSVTQRRHLSEVRKKLYAEGVLQPWSKGLTKDTDERIARIAETAKKMHSERADYAMHGKNHSRKTRQLMSEHHRTKRGYAPALLGKKQPPFSEEHRRKISEAQIALGRWRGKKNPTYNGGSSKLTYPRDFSKNFKRNIRERDKNVCQMCGISNEKCKEKDRQLEVHHIDYDKNLNISPNCISLCRNCHVMTNNNRSQWTAFFQSLLAERYGYEYVGGKPVITLKEVRRDSR